ncbi:hypothetical protein Tco_0631914 [Tanacetum coccineum]
MKIRRIRACTHQRPQKNEAQYAGVRYKEFGELIQPFKDPEQVSQLDRKLLKTTESLSMFMAEIAKRLDQNTNNLQASTDFALRNQQASIKALEIQVKQMSIILHRKLSGNLKCLTIIKPRGNDETISTSVKAAMPSIRLIDATQYDELNETEGVREELDKTLYQTLARFKERLDEVSLNTTLTGCRRVNFVSPRVGKFQPR